MKHRIAALTIAMLAVTAFSGIASAAHVTTLSTSLTGSEEVGSGDKNGKGYVELYVYVNGTICYEAKVQAIGREIVGAHIHLGAAGTNGGVVVNLNPAGATVTGNMAENCVIASAELAAAIVANPSHYYVNVHTPTYPGGAIRGQLGD